MEIYKELSREARNRLSRMEFRPTLEPSAVGCEVCFTTFAPFGGFTRNRLTVTKRDVGISISVHATGHVPYRCPFMF